MTNKIRTYIPLFLLYPIRLTIKNIQKGVVKKIRFETNHLRTKMVEKY
jgi:hypothetical protein